MYLYTDPILTAAKKYRCRCEGLCNEWGDKWFTSTSKVSTEKRIHNKNIFEASNTLPPFNKIFMTCNGVFPSVSTIFKFVSESFVVVPKLCEGIMPKKHFHKKVNLTELEITSLIPFGK